MQTALCEIFPLYADQQYQSAVKTLEQIHDVWETEMEVGCDVRSFLLYSPAICPVTVSMRTQKFESSVS